LKVRKKIKVAREKAGKAKNGHDADKRKNAEI